MRSGPSRAGSPSSRSVGGERSARHCSDGRTRWRADATSPLPPFDASLRDAIEGTGWRDAVQRQSRKGGMAVHIDMASFEPRYTEDPYPFFAQLREQSPVT